MMSDPSSRSAERRRRLQAIEKEQLLEDMEALKMTEEQRRSLQSSFASVKVEFFDLDGLHWSRSALRKRSHRPAAESSVPQRPTSNQSLVCSPPASAFAVLTNADLQSFAPEDTIRVPTSHILLHNQKPYRTRTSRSRSPVKGVFPPGLPSTRDGDGEVFFRDRKSSIMSSVPESEDQDHERGRVRRPVGARPASPIRLTFPTSSFESGSPPEYISYSSPSLMQTMKSRHPVIVIPDAMVNDDDWNDVDDSDPLKTPVPRHRAPPGFLG